MLGMSQDKLGQAIGLTFQQIQKYERGANRIGASRLYEFSRVLDVPVSFFFEGLGEARPFSPLLGLRTPDGGDERPDSFARRETLELVRAYYRVPSARIRRRLFELTKALAAGVDSE